MTKKLGYKRQTFAIKVAIEGKTYTDAYREAFNVGPKTDPHTTHVDAHRLAKNEQVAEEILRLRSQMEDEAIMTKTEMLILASEDARNAQTDKGEPDYYTRRECRKEVAKLMGYNEVEKQDVTIKANVSTNVMELLRKRHEADT